MPPVVVLVVVPTRIAAPTGVPPVEITACVFAVSTPVPVAILYSEIWLDCRLTGKKKFSRGCGNEQQPG